MVDFPLRILEVGRISDSLRTSPRTTRTRVGGFSKVTTEGRIDDKGMVFEELTHRTR